MPQVRRCAAATVTGMADHLLVMTTSPDRESAARIASSAVALDGTGPRGGVVALLASRRRVRYAELEAHIIAEHPWDKPEVTGIELARGSAAYFAWMETATAPEG